MTQERFRIGFMAWGGVLIITLIGLALRFYDIDGKSLWTDEVATIASASGNLIDPKAYELHGQQFDAETPVPALVYKAKATQQTDFPVFEKTVQVLKSNVHPPLFFWMMGIVIHFIGYEPTPLRLPAIFFGIACIPMFFWVVRRVGSTSLALLSCSILAFSTYQVFHSQDARQYTFLILLALSSMWLMLRLVQNAKQHWWEWSALALLSAMGLYTQYFYITFLGALLVYGVFKKRQESRFLLSLMLTGVVVLLMLLPWLPTLKVQTQYYQLVGHFSKGLWKPWRLPETIWRMLNEFLVPGSDLMKVLAALVLGTAGFGVWRARRVTQTVAMPPSVLLALCWVVGVVGGQLLLDLIKGTHTITIRRYTLLASPGYYLLLASALWHNPLWAKGKQAMRVSATAFFVLILLGSTMTQLLWNHTGSDDFKHSAAWINKQSQFGDLVLVNRSGATAVGVAYYLHPQTMMLGLNGQSGADFQPGKPWNQKLLNVLPSAKRLWVVFSHSNGSSKRIITQVLQAQGWQLSLQKKFKGVLVCRFEPQALSR